MSKEVLIENGREVYYDIVDDGIVYYDRNGNKVSVDENQLTTIKKIGDKMNYEQIMEVYGLDEDIIAKFEARGCAYKPASINGNQVYVGNYLMLDDSGNPFTVLETTYKGQLQKSYNFNQRTIGFYNIDELSQIGLVEEIDSFEVSKNTKPTVDELFDAPFEVKSVETIKVFRVRIADSVDMVVYHNVDQATNTGSKLYNIYLAEKQLREKPKNLDSIFYDTLTQEISSMSTNMDEKHIASA